MFGWKNGIEYYFQCDTIVKIKVWHNVTIIDLLFIKEKITHPQM